MTTLQRESDGDVMVEYYEPWTPDVGQRVRVRLSGECWYWGHRDRTWVDGATGTVCDVLPLGCNGGHGYQVNFDRPWPSNPDDPGHRLIESSYAAIELEPIE